MKQRVLIVDDSQERYNMIKGLLSKEKDDSEVCVFDPFKVKILENLRTKAREITKKNVITFQGVK
jgi:CheY-like chemotaxis protein